MRTDAERTLLIPPVPPEGEPMWTWIAVFDDSMLFAFHETIRVIDLVSCTVLDLGIAFYAFGAAASIARASIRTRPYGYAPNMPGHSGFGPLPIAPERYGHGP